MELKECKKIIDAGLNTGKLIIVIGRGLPAFEHKASLCDSDTNRQVCADHPYPQCSRVKF